MTKRRIRSHKGGRTARASAPRLTPQEKARLDEVLQRRGVNHTDWYIGHVSADYAAITGEDTMTDEYVYGWYRYADDKDIKFRYPASRESDLKQDGKSVTVEVTQGGNKWDSRRGIVNWGGGNFVVTPRN